MRIYLFILLVSIGTISALRAEVPSLEYETDIGQEDLDLLLANTTPPKVSRLQLTLQKFGTIFITYLMRLRDYAEEGYEKTKATLFALLARIRNTQSNPEQAPL